MMVGSLIQLIHKKICFWFILMCGKIRVIGDAVDCLKKWIKYVISGEAEKH